MKQTMRQKIESLTEYGFFDRGENRHVYIISKNRKDIGYFKKENNQLLFVPLGSVIPYTREKYPVPVFYKGEK